MIKGSIGHHKHPIGAVPFEAFHNGSWHGVNSIRIRNGGLFVKFVCCGSSVEHNIDGDYLRLHSRKATCLDCSHVLRPGADVCVKQASSRGETKSSVPLYRDARLIKIMKKHYTDQCLCLFAVIFYKDQCPGSKGKVIAGTIDEVVTIGDVFILQKLQSWELQDRSLQWSSAEDCLHHNRSKLLSARFSTEITHLIVLSILRGMEFNIKVVEGKIIYQITKRDQVRYSVDSMSIPPGFGKNMDIISYKPRAEALRPRIITVPVIQVNKCNLVEYGCATEMDELDSAQDVEVLYDRVDLRRSKRMKTQPDRFSSYDAPNFNRTYKKKEDNASSTMNENSESDLSWDSPVQEESGNEEVLGNSGVKQTAFSPFMVKEDPRSMEGQHKNPMKRTQCSFPVKEKPASMEIEKNTIEQRCSDSHIPHTPAMNKEKCSRPPLSVRLKPFTSSHSLGGNSEPAFCQKRGRKRKRHMREREYKDMIDQCIGNIQCEIERDSDFKLDVQIMNFSGNAYREEDFTWPSSTDSQEEKDEFEELWKEMDYALASLELLEQKQIKGDTRKLVYHALVGLLQDNDIAVRLAACSSLCYLFQESSFSELDLFECLPTCWAMSFKLIEDVQEFDSKVQVLNFISVLLEHAGDKIIPFASQLSQFFQMIWDESAGESLLQIQLLTALRTFVSSLGFQSPLSYNMLIPILQNGVNIDSPDALNLLEDSVLLWEATLSNAPSIVPQLLDLFPYLVGIVNRSFDHLEVTIKIIEDYTIFGGSEFLKSHGASLANIVDTIVGNVNDKGLVTSLPIVDLLIQIFPLEAPPLISSALQKLIFISLSQDDGQNPSRTAVRASSGAILARLLVMNTNFSAQLLSEPPLLASIQQAGIVVNNNLLVSLIDMWIDKVDDANATQQKEYAMALSVVLTLQVPQVIDKLDDILSVCTTVIIGSREVKTDDDTSGDITSSSWIGNDGSGYSNTSSKELRKRQVKDSDPIKQASLENVLRENLKACAALHGDAAFNAAISRIHPSAFAQLQQALNTA